MKIGKREIILISLLAVAVYALIFVKVIWARYIPEFQELETKIEKKSAEKASLESDLKNLPTLKLNLNSKKVQNERLENYLVSSANFPDSVEYIDKLAKTFDNYMSDVIFSPPEEKVIKDNSKDNQNTTDGSAEKKENEKKYYEFKIAFKAMMTYDKAMELVNYVEGSSKRSKVSSFKLASLDQTVLKPVDPNNPLSQVQISPAEALNTFQVEMTVNLYSMNLGNADRLYDYSRKRFNNYQNNDGVIFVPDNQKSLPGQTISSNIGFGSTSGSSANSSSNNISTGSTGTNVASVEKKNYYLVIDVKSYMFGGNNFTFFGLGGRNNTRQFRSKERPNVKLSFDSSRYYINVTDSDKTYSMDGKLPEENNIEMYVALDFPLNVKYNENLGLNIQITNNSGKRVNVNLFDKVNRSKIMDRSGIQIFKSSESEKIYII